MADRADDENDGIGVIEQVDLSDDSDDDFQYDQVDQDGLDDDDDSDDDEDLETALRSLSKDPTLASSKVQAKSSAKAGSTLGAVVETRPSVVDDYIRNFLIKVGMTRSLDAFNTEWYELQSKGKLSEEDCGVVPDIYIKYDELDNEVKSLRKELGKMREITARAQGTWDKFRKERDFHRMHHKRVVQEKGKLLVDIKRLKKHFQAYEPTLKELEKKYEAAMKEKMLMRLERDRMAGKVETLEAQLKQFERQPTTTDDAPVLKPKKKKKGADVKIPVEEPDNPYLDVSFDSPTVEQYTLSKTFRGHTNAVSALAFHPKKPIMATVSDDETWKLWSVPNCELIMSGEGHKGWLSSVDFHPNGTHLATGAGDNTVKIWDFKSASCAATFTDHTSAVWGVAYHWSGDFVVSASMDHSSKLWDLNSNRCRLTFRGHVDSVNSVCFQPYTNNICTGSGDKTVSLWDIRSGLCMQTFYGHNNACNHVCFNNRADTIASVDADGVVKLWDVRMVSERATLNAGANGHPLNECCFDRSGTVLAAGSDDGTVKMFDCNTDSYKHLCDISGHEDAVQAVMFDPAGKYMVSGGSDSTFRIWK